MQYFYTNTIENAMAIYSITIPDFTMARRFQKALKQYCITTKLFVAISWVSESYHTSTDWDGVRHLNKCQKSGLIVQTHILFSGGDTSDIKLEIHL